MKTSLLRRIIGPPRRWSIFTETGRRQIQNNLPIEVYFNGERVRGCVSYDCPRGTVEVYERDERDQYVVRDGELMTKWLTGKVQVCWK